MISFGVLKIEIVLVLRTSENVEERDATIVLRSKVKFFSSIGYKGGHFDSIRYKRSVGPLLSEYAG